MTRCTVSDLIKAEDFAVSKRTITPEGYLIAPANISRTGVQIYTARELGQDGGDKQIRLYRPPSEVFSRASLASFEAKPITDDHPPDDVTAETWSAVAVGDFHDVAKADAQHVGARIIVRDLGTVRDVQAGKKELSCGYSFALDMTPGTTPEGEPYDGVQREILGNHLAIVRAGRAGSQVRIADSTNERTDTMGTIETEFFTQAAAREAEHRRWLAGDFTPPTRAGDFELTVSGQQAIGAISTRDAHLAYEAARSRMPARGAARYAVAAVDEDDDDGVTRPAMDVRDAWQHRETQRSRLPAGTR